MSKTIQPPTSSLSPLIWLPFLFLTLTWGSSFILVKRGLEAYSAWQVASLRLTSAFIAIIPFAIMAIRHIPIKKLPYVFVCSMLSMFIPAFLFSNAQLGVSSSVAGILNALTPAFTFLVGILFFRLPNNRLQVLGLSIGFLGSAILVLRNAQGEFALNGYAFYVVAAAMCYGFNVNVIKRYLYDIKPVHFTAVAIAMGGLLASFYFFSTNWYEIYQTSPNGKPAFWALLTLGVVGTAVAQIVFNMMLQYTSAVFASSITYFVPLVAVLWGVLDGEVLTLWHFLGLVFIVGGVLIINKTK